MLDNEGDSGAVGKAVHREHNAEVAVSQLKKRIKAASQIGEVGERRRGYRLKVGSL